MTNLLDFDKLAII